MLTFAWPWIFILLPLPWVLRYFVSPASQQQTALKVPFYTAITQFSSQSTERQSPYTARKLLAYSVWLLLIVALAGPQWLGKPVSLPRAGRNLMLVLDISGSMRLPDMKLQGKPLDRLSVVKSVAGKFIQEREGDRMGLVLFGTRAYLQTPLTFDHKTVKSMLDDASIGLAGQMTAIGDAIGLGVKRLIKTPPHGRVMILLTDGKSNTGVLNPVQAAKLAQQQHIIIYTIGLGAKQLIMNGLLGPQAFNPSAELDEKSLQAIAKLTGGKYFRATNTRALQEIYQTINQLEPSKVDKTVMRPIKALYYWPLALAFIISLYFALRRMTIINMEIVQWLKLNIFRLRKQSV